MTTEISESGLRSFGFMLSALMFLVLGITAINTQFKWITIKPEATMAVYAIIFIALLTLLIVTIMLTKKNYVPEAIAFFMSMVLVLWGMLSGGVISGIAVIVILAVCLVMFIKITDWFLLAYGIVGIAFVILEILVVENAIAGFDEWVSAPGIALVVMAAIAIIVSVLDVFAIEKEEAL